ncbi:hypothetical protein B1C78_08810 [Thioalkalivibrio denitrificans]|uniref:Uncharacterized protein n=2 Tax=Thioalkalivibrio denitrificans TaxID=108003 RepID=A0A1V3NH45_9GAMM|nr:hypothetical protein B1C78_08810 [Thioalkalivibrio denitrificans]
MYEESMRNLAGIANVQMLLGDTRTNLRTILQSEDEILFWLDAHWSGGETYGEQDECPIIEELELILSSNLSKFAIMIDDARLFMAPPPAPHNYEVWPSLTDIMAVLPKNFDMIIWNDVIFLTPKELIFRKHMQTRATYEWMNGPHRYGRGFKSGLRSVLRLMGRK